MIPCSLYGDIKLDIIKTHFTWLEDEKGKKIEEKLCNVMWESEWERLKDEWIEERETEIYLPTQW